MLHCVMYPPYQQRSRKVGGTMYCISLHNRVLHCVMYPPSYQQRSKKVGGTVYCISLSTQQSATLCNVSHKLPTEKQESGWYSVLHLSLPNRVLHCVMYPPSYQQRSRKVGGTVYCISLSTQQSATLCNVSPKLPTEKQESGWYSVLHLSLHPTERKKGSGWRTRS